MFLVLLATLLLAQSLPRKRFFGPALLAGLHVEAVLLDFLNDVFLLHLALKPPQCILKHCPCHIISRGCWLLVVNSSPRSQALFLVLHPLSVLGCLSSYSLLPR